MKRTIFFVLVVSLLLACTTSYFANIKISAHQIYKTEIMEQREGYEKVKITNLETGKVEYLESILDDDGLYMYLATSEEGSFEIKLDGSSIRTTNLDTNETTLSEIESTEVEKGDIEENFLMILHMKQIEYKAN
ncbi:hypothetical protein [Desulfitobacterium sp. PCE1]|uniref:hypothetical protein n=1 Tax=Desulfitobacterium sp. PCE1 TaxID=146907 RepID=UPI00035CD3B3|nr:hypothetical protein [Desulfitobacterium sp. PCE1]